MMIYVPFIYFILLMAFFVWRQKRFGVSAYMSGLFAVTSLIGVIAVKENLLGAAGVLFANENLHLGFMPTMLYCVLITLAILPFSKLDKLKINEIKDDGGKWFVVFCAFLLALAALNFYLASDGILNILKNGTWLSDKKYTVNGYPAYSGFWAARTAHYNGAKSLSDIRLENLPKIFGYIYYLHDCTILLLPCFFFSLCCTTKKWWFNILLLIGSISVLFMSIQRADRTEIINYVLMFGFCMLLFWRFLKRRQWILLGILLVPMVAAGSIYMVGVTKARFHTDDHGEMKGLVQYAGQPFSNFCYVYENAKTDTLYTERVFPMVNHFVLGNDYETPAVEQRNAMHGFKTDVFYSFLGTIMLDLGKIPMILWTLAFVGLCYLIFVRRMKNKTLSVWNILTIFALAEVPVFGIFYYRFYSFYFAMVFWLAFAMLIVSILDEKGILKTIKSRKK